MSQKGLAPILIILLLAAAVGGYFLYQKQAKPVTQTPKVDETANWKTYTNSVYKFSFKYPPSDSVEKCGGEPTDTGEIGGLADGTEKECFFIRYKLADSDDISTSDISIDIIKSSFADAIKDKTNNKKLTTINNRRSYVIVQEISENTTEKIKEVFIEQSPTETIWLNGRYDNPVSVALFDTVFSTFKFLDQKNDSMPEGVVSNFYQWYTACVKDRTTDCRYENQPHVSSKLKENISAQGGSGYDHIICAQNTVDIARVDKASISGNTAKVVVHELPYDEGIKVELKLIENQWKINNIICPQKS